MVPPVRWYHLLSSWIFILSALYPLHKIPTYPLNLLALTGCVEVLANPLRENMVKNIYILFLHLAPFLWIPYDLSRTAIGIALAVIAVYVVFIYSRGYHPVDIYMVLLSEHHTSTAAFVKDRFGLRLPS